MDNKTNSNCAGGLVLAINDTMNVLNGKWKLPILGTMIQGAKRFGELQRNIGRITPRMLSKELKDLEANGIVARTVVQENPMVVEYTLTASGVSFRQVLDAMVVWGQMHRSMQLPERKAG